MIKTIVHISDTHEAHQYIQVPECDLLIHTGDMTYTGKLNKVKEFLEWFSKQPAKYKVYIAGNHDWLYERNPNQVKMLHEEYPGIIYLEDSGVTIEQFNIWGSPVQPTFCNWAFNRNAAEREEHWKKIPEGTNLLLTHGPPYGILDGIEREEVHWNAALQRPESTKTMEHTGCKFLLDRVKVIKPEFHLFGHIHEHHGLHAEDGVTYSNGSSLNEHYKGYRNPITITVE